MYLCDLPYIINRSLVVPRVYMPEQAYYRATDRLPYLELFKVFQIRFVKFISTTILLREI